MTSDTDRVDGRDARWTKHRQERRRQLVQATIKAVRKHGPNVGMDEIAQVAGTSKTVFYRHFGDRLGLYLAVTDAVEQLILKDFDAAITSGISDTADAAAPLGDDPHAAVEAVIDSYLRLVESDPELYRFVVRRPAVDVPADADPVAGLTGAIAARLTEIFRALLVAADRDPAPALIWGHALVGFVREAADRWLADPDKSPRAEVVSHLAEFASIGLDGVLSPRRP